MGSITKIKLDQLEEGKRIMLRKSRYRGPWRESVVLRSSWLATIVMATAFSALVACSAVTSPSVGQPSPNSLNGKLHTKSQVSAPFSGVYLGAWVNPAGSINNQTPSPQSIIQQTASLESGMARPLALHLHYFTWQRMKSLATDPEIVDDQSHNRVPVISWHCLDDIHSQPGYTLYQQTHGATQQFTYSDLQTIFTQIQSLKTPDGSSYPIMIRFFWEFNLNAVGMDPANVNGNDGCFTSDESYQKEFIDAWQQIYTALQGVFPKPNASMIWNPNVTDAVEQGDPYASFYPQPNFVDWIGFDGYNKQVGGSGPPIGFGAIFVSSLSSILGNQGTYGSKPLIIGETGSCDEYPNYGYQSQTDFLSSVKNTLESGTAPFNSVNAFMYFDAPATNYTINGPGGGQCSWSLLSGKPEWDTLSADPYFNEFVAVP